MTTTKHGAGAAKSALSETALRLYLHYPILFSDGAACDGTFVYQMKDGGFMEGINNGRNLCRGSSEREAEIKRQIFEKVVNRMKKLAARESTIAELSPDVIVISDDDSWLFEPQNSRASAWLHRRCGMAAENRNSRERIRVHPCESPKIVAELKAAGFAVFPKYL